MPRLARILPAYRKHRSSGQAVVTLSDQDFYLGPHGTKVSRDAYDREVAQWLARGRRPQDHSGDGAEISCIELIVAYERFAKGYYRKHDKTTRETAAIHSAAKVVKDLYGREPANAFGPLKLQAVRQAMIRIDWCRSNINKQVGRIVRMFSWGVSQELVKPGIAEALREVKGLHLGRSEARESAPVLPVEDSIVNATLEHVPAVVADMIKFQRLTGCRPEDVCSIRPCDLDMSKTIWIYRPPSHKMMHRGRGRVICIGPKAQDVLRSYLLREATSYCFCPMDSERKRRREAHAHRVTPIGYGNRPGTNKSGKPKRPAGGHYDTNSYRRAITRACELAFGMPMELRKKPKGETEEAKQIRLERAAQWRRENCWAPNRLRHAAGTEIRKRFGLEAAQVTLGHAAANVTEIYAERDIEKAAEVMRHIG